MRISIHCLVVLLVLLAIATTPAGAHTLKLWHNNRITPEQPFPARVVGVLPSWIGYELLLEEITDKKRVVVGHQEHLQGPRLCIARLTKTEDLEYTPVSYRGSLGTAHDFHKVTLLHPGVAVNDFSWSIGAYTIGRRCGEEDFVSQQYPRWTRRGSDRKPEPQTQSEDDTEAAEFVPREQRLVGVWKPEPGQERIAYEKLTFRADGTGTARIFKKTEAFEWDLVDHKLYLVLADEKFIRRVPVGAVTRNYLVIRHNPLYYRKQCLDAEVRQSEDTRATVDDQQTGQPADKSFGLPNSYSGKLSEEQEKRVPKALRNAYMVESLRSTTESELAEELKHKTLVAEETHDGKRYVALKDLRHVTFSEAVSGHMIVIERHLVIADPPYRSALIAALHLLAASGEAEHVKAILEEHPDLVDAKRTFKQPRKPLGTDSFSPLHHAVENGHESVVSVLLDRGADVNRTVGKGWTPLHLAARRGHLSVVKQLVKHGADVHAKTAAIPETFEIAPGASADDTEPIRLPAIAAMTPLDSARKAEHADVVNFLESIEKGRRRKDR